MLLSYAVASKGPPTGGRRVSDALRRSSGGHHVAPARNSARNTGRHKRLLSDGFASAAQWPPTSTSHAARAKGHLTAASVIHARRQFFRLHTGYAFFFFGIFAPDLRASLRAIATACFRLVTFLPLPDLSVPSFFSFITL